MRKNLLLFFALMLAVMQQAHAQSRMVTGTVTDQATGQGLPGVSVIVKGTSIGLATDSEGRYSISVPDNGNTLVFRFIGYIPVEQTIGNSSTVNVKLQLDTKQLSEVIVVGYGTQTKAEFTGSATSVSGEKIKAMPVQSFDQALGGRAAGVNIIQPNGVLNNPPVIRIRGMNSISLSSFPLVVVDGIPISTGDNSTNSAANNALGDINPADIESIDILKDAASTAIYGSRAAGGVLIITTKRGKAGKPRVNYDTWAGVTQAVRLPELLNAQQYMDIKNEGVLNAKILGGNADNPKVASAFFFPSYNEDGSLVDTRWYDEVYRTAYSQNHSLSVSGGTEATTYFFSANVTDQDGFIKQNSFRRNAIRFNIDHKLTDWLKLSGGSTYTNSFNAAPNTGSVPGAAFNTSGLGRLAVVTAPNVAPRNPDGTYNIRTDNTMGRGNNLQQSGFVNPLAILDLNSFTSESDRIFASFGADVRIFKGLNFNTSYSVDKLNIESISFQNPLHGDGFTNKGNATNTQQRLNNSNFINTLNYQTSLADKHNIGLLIGTDVQMWESRGWGANRFGVADNFFNEYQGNFTSIAPSGNYINERALVSGFSRVNYDFAKRYYLTFNFRRDGNSALAADNKWGNFGGVSGGWALSEEEFYKGSGLADIATSVKLRASWGRVGNGNVLGNPSLFLYGSGLYGDSPTLFFSQAGNSDLGWETSEQTNVGADINFLNDRIQFEVTYFNNNIDNMILNAPQSPSKGIPGNTIAKNVGSMYNRGLELAVTATPITKGNFSWTTSVNFTKIKNEVTALSDGNADIFATTGGLETTNITRVGEPVGSIWGVKTVGINPTNGRRIFINKNGEKVQYSHVVGEKESRWTYLDGSVAPAITSAGDGQILGNALPTWYGGFQNTFKYGNIDLGLNFTYSGGNVIYNGTKAGLRDMRFWNNHTDVLDRWTPEKQTGSIPRIVWGDNVSNGSALLISENVEKADFLKLQTATIGYSIPTTGLVGKSGINSLRIYGQVFNALVFTKYTGADPEISTNGNSNTAPGVERNTVPQSRTFTVGLNVGF